MEDDLRVSNRVSIPLKEVELKAILAQGSGGQNVNKVSSAVQLFFDIRASSLPVALKDRLLARSDHRITESGVVVIKAQESRTQEANRVAALQRLAELVKSCLNPPKKRRPTKPSRASKERRLKGKTIRGRTKSLRRPPRTGE